MLPLRGKIPRLHRPELLLAKNFFSSLPLLHQLKETKSRGTSALVTQKWNQL